MSTSRARLPFARLGAGPLLTAGALLLPLAWSAPALAEELPPYATCTTTPTEADVAAAKGAFQAGQAAFNEADYTRAITYWEDAYRRDCTAHKLLINLARAYELNDQLGHAIRALETYNERVPDNPEQAQSATRIQRFKERLAQQAAQPGTPPPADPPPVTPPTGGPPEDDVTPPTDDGVRPLYPLFVAGGGAVLGIVGAVLYFPGQSTLSDFDEKCPNRRCPAGVDDSEANSARSQVTIGGILMGVGGAAIIGGTLWYFLQPKQPRSAEATRRNVAERSQLTPVVGQGFTGLSWSGSF
ncbi:MAG: hypothetical protein KIT72_01475 [Polyangiaceae bacterium]|nr:hypothetical protein [Polyangiaceae bacterium]MCW5789067.1 hypothetical protein [Polyangiaceae bacterium]